MPGGNSTPWGEQVETMTRAWTDAQKKMWQSWYDLAQAAPASPFSTDLTGQWQKMAAQGFQAWTANAEPTVKDVAEHLVTSQKSFMSLLEFLTNAWKAVGTQMQTGTDWQSTLEAYGNLFRQQLLQSPEKMMSLNQDTGELWRLYLEEFNKLSQPWLKSFQLRQGHFGQAVNGDGSALLDMTNLYWDAYERTFGRLLESPTMGYTRELNEKILKGFGIWQDFRRASFEYQVVLANLWVKAFERVMAELTSLTQKGQPLKSLRELIQLWNNVADPVFIEAFRSESFIRVQGRLLSTAMQFRLQQREITELFLKTSDIATRSDVDEAHHKIYEQRKEIKALKKALAEIPTTPPQEFEDTRRQVDELRQEVTALKEALAALTAGQAPATKPKAKSSPKTQPAKTSRAASSRQEGDKPA